MRAMLSRIMLSAMVALCLTGVTALSATLDELAEMGSEAMKAGKYKEAVKHFEKIDEIGKTYENILSIRFDLGWCYYLTGQYEKAIPLFDSLSGKRSPSEAIRKQAMFLLAECHARLAGTQPEDKPARKKNLDKALELHTRFQEKYPENTNIPQSFYGRAYAYYLDGQMEKAEADLKTVINQYPNNPAVRDAMYLLAIVYSDQALEKAKTGDKKNSKVFMDKSRDIFSKLSKGEGNNLALANDSAFSLAETWFNAREYLEAISYYQQVRTKSEVLQSLQALLDRLQQQLAREYGEKKDTAMTKAAIDKLQVQKRAVSEAADLMISSYFRAADAFYRLKRYDEVRMICRHLLKFTQDQQKQQAYYLIITTYLEEKDAEAAVREFEGFQEVFGLDNPMVDTVSLSIGQLYLGQGDIPRALQHFAKSVEEYPEGKHAEDAMYLKVATEYMEKQYENTIKGVSDYLEEYPKGKYVANALYYKAMSLAALDKWDEALTTITEVINRFPKGTANFASNDEAFYQKGWMLNEAKKWGEAVKHLETFLDRFKKSTLRPEAMYQLGAALNQTDQLDKAKAVLQAIAKEYKDHYIAPMALYQVAVICFKNEDFPQMAEAMKVLVQSYPDNPIVTDAYFWLGWIAKKDEHYDEAIEYFKKCLKSDPANPRAPEAQLLTAQSYDEKAEGMGLPSVLSEEQRAVYRSTRLAAAQSYEDLLAGYPGSVQVLEAVPGIAVDIYSLVRYRQMTEQEASDYFDKAMTRHKDEPDVNSQLLFSLGSYQMKNNEEENALASFNKALAMNPEVRLSPDMLSEYAEALKEADKLSEAETVYRKILADYADDPRALAPAWFGIADVKYRENNFDAARELFEKVLKEYEWYERGKQGRVMLAKILEKNEKYEEAEKMFEQVWKQEKGEARLGAMLGVARCQLEQARQAKKAGRTGWKELIQVADQNLTKIIVLFEAYPEFVAEALWLKGNAYELIEDKQKARETYTRLVLEDQYKNTSWAKLAREQLKTLGGIAATTKPAINQ